MPTVPNDTTSLQAVGGLGRLDGYDPYQAILDNARLKSFAANGELTKKLDRLGPTAPVYSPEQLAYLRQINDYTSSQQTGYNLTPEGLTNYDNRIGAAVPLSEEEMAAYASSPYTDHFAANFGYTGSGNLDNWLGGTLKAFPNQQYRLVDRSTGQVLYSGQGYNAGAQIANLASGLVDKSGQQSNFVVESTAPGSDQWTRVMSQEPQGHGFMTALGLMAAMTGLAALPAGALGGAAAGTTAGTTAASSIGGGVGAGLSGIGSAATGAAGLVATGAPITVIGGTGLGTFGTAALGAGLTGAGVLAANGAGSVGGATGAGSTAGSAAGTDALAEFTDPIVVSHAPLPGLGVGDALAATTAATAPFVPGSFQTAGFNAPTTEPTSGPTADGAGVVDPATNEIVVNAPGVGSGAGAGVPAWVTAAGATPLVAASTGAGLTAAEAEALASSSAANAGAGAVGEGAAGAGAAGASTLDKVITGLKAGTLLTGVLGNLGGSGSGGGATVPTGFGNNLAANFSASLPTSTGFAHGAPRAMPQQDWTRYAMGPEQSFFTNVPKAPGMAKGGLAALAKTPAQPAPLGGRSDDVHAMVSPGEYVLDAETVGLLGNGDTKAGAKALDQFRVSVRKHKGKALAKGKVSPNAKRPEQYMRGGLI